jgi:hypothetical protein
LKYLVLLSGKPCQCKNVSRKIHNNLKLIKYYLSLGGGDILPNGGGRTSMNGGIAAPNSGGTIIPIGGSSPAGPANGNPTNDAGPPPAAAEAPGRPGNGGNGRLLAAASGAATELEKEASTRLPGPEEEGGRSRLEKPFTATPNKEITNKKWQKKSV